MQDKLYSLAENRYNRTKKLPPRGRLFGGGTAMLKGKTVLLGVTGGIAAYKAAALASAVATLDCTTLEICSMPCVISTVFRACSSV